jgi:hypothetical protein
MENENTCRHGNTLDRPCDACHPEHIEILHAALTRAQTVLATIINAGLTFDGGVGGKFMGEIRATEVEARKALCFDGSSQADASADPNV